MNTSVFSSVNSALYTVVDSLIGDGKCIVRIVNLACIIRSVNYLPAYKGVINRVAILIYAVDGLGRRCSNYCSCSGCIFVLRNEFCAGSV